MHLLVRDNAMIPGVVSGRANNRYAALTTFGEDGGVTIGHW
jgi:hypothetical protein